MGQLFEFDLIYAKINWVFEHKKVAMFLAAQILALVAGLACLWIGIHHTLETLNELKTEKSFQANFLGPLVFFLDWFTDTGKKHRALAIKYLVIGVALCGVVFYLRT